MSPKSRAASVALMLAVVAVSARAAADDEPRMATGAPSSVSRVRAVSTEARQLIESAVASSPTVARLVAALQSSDLMVYVETDAFLSKVQGEVLLLQSNANVRPVRIKVRTSAFAAEMVSVLGHELQHALEIAGAPEVRDSASQERLYRRIGWETRRGYFETDAALEAGRRVAAEVAASQPPRRVQ